MDSRLNLQCLLEQILGSTNVYYQPPASLRIKYPAIIYSRSDIQNEHANDASYKRSKVYSVTVVDEDPDSEIVDKIADLPFCRFDRHYTSDNLNHDVFTLHYNIGGLLNGETCLGPNG